MAYVPALGQSTAQALPPPSAFSTREAALKLAANLSPAQKSAMLTQALSALPRCWGGRSENCADGKFDAPLTWPREQCHALAYGYLADWDKMTAAVSSIPDCDERDTLKWAAIAGAAGLLVGLGIGTLLSGDADGIRG